LSNYINNKDFLIEIAKSKTTYCSFKDKDLDAIPDLYLRDVNAIPESIEEGKIARAKRLSKLAYDDACASGNKAKQEDFYIDPSSIDNNDVVFRVMMWDHIPMDESSKKSENLDLEELLPATKLNSLFEEITDDGNDNNDNTIENNESLETVVPESIQEEKQKATKYIKVNFPPFQHFRVDENNTPYCVGKSHWKGGLDSGFFSKDHGKMTNKLAQMFILLCDRYASRGNWRSYTYNQEMRGQALLQLSKVGLQFDESKSNNPFAFYTTITTHSFYGVLNAEKRQQSIRDDILEMNNLNPSYTRQNEWGGAGDE
jgi:hypothetical protein